MLIIKNLQTRHYKEERRSNLVDCIVRHALGPTYGDEVTSFPAIANVIIKLLN